MPNVIGSAAIKLLCPDNFLKNRLPVVILLYTQRVAKIK